MAKRLKRNRKGSIVLPSGETITKREQYAYKSAIVSYNYHRKKSLQNVHRADKYYKMDTKDDFTLLKRSAGFGQFTTKAQFKRAMKIAKYVSSGQAERDRSKQYIENYAKALFNVYGEDSYKAIEILMSRDEEAFRQAVENDELTPIEEHYYEDKRIMMERLNKSMFELNKIKAK